MENKELSKEETLRQELENTNDYSSEFGQPRWSIYKVIELINHRINPLLSQIADLKSRLEISEQQKILNYNCLVDANKEITDLKIRLEIWRGTTNNENKVEKLDYFQALENWEKSIYCNECGEDDLKKFSYSRTVANGDCYRCNNCKNECLIAHKPNEDTYYNQ